MLISLLSHSKQCTPSPSGPPSSSIPLAACVSQVQQPLLSFQGTQLSHNFHTQASLIKA